MNESIDLFTFFILLKGGRILHKHHEKNCTCCHEKESIENVTIDKNNVHSEKERGKIRDDAERKKEEINKSTIGGF